MSLVFLRHHWSAAIAAAVLWLGGSAVDAAEPAPSETALSLVPADAEAYGSNLRMGETITMIAQSNTWKSIWNHPFAGLAKQQFQAEVTKEGSEWEQFLAFFQKPENSEIPALVGDALSHEIISYAGPGTGDFLSLIQEVIGAARYGPGIQQAVGGGDNDDANRERIRFALLALAEDPARVQTPEFVFGFKVSNPDAVTKQLARLDTEIKAQIAKKPQIGEYYKKVTIDGDEFLTLAANGSMIPWDQANLAQFEAEDGEFDELQKRLKELKFTIAIGVRKGFLLISIGDTAEHLAKFGGPGPKLASVPELKALDKFADRKVISISYTSKTILEKISTNQDDIAGIGELVKTLLVSAELPDALEGKITADLDGLLKAASGQIVPPGAYTNISLRTAHGWETFTYDYTASPNPPAKPLTILEHVGGKPLFLAAGRSNTTVKDYREIAHWLGVFGGHVEEVIAVKAPDADKALDIYRDDFKPLLMELGRILETLWLPALDDGQMAIVLDAKWTSRQWHAAAPPSETALPLPEIGFILGVSDADKFVEAMKEYRGLANKVIATARKHDQSGEIPEFEIPPPTVETDANIRYAFYPIPREWGIDEQFQPTGGLTSTMATLTLSKGHAKRLLTKTPLAIPTAPFADRSRPLESVSHFDWAGWVDAISAWSGYGMAIGGVPPDDPTSGMAQQVMDVLRVFQGYSSVTYREVAVTVTHSECVFRDLPAPIGGVGGGERPPNVIKE